MAACGVSLDPGRMVFCCRKVEFAGLYLKGGRVGLMLSHVKAIVNFPSPWSVTDVKAWVGLMQQVSSHVGGCATSEEFCHLLKLRAAFGWDEDLEVTFCRSKAVVADEIRHSMEAFGGHLTTCLQTDYRSRGIGH